MVCSILRGNTMKNNLKHLRKTHNLTQKEVAKILGISQQQYSSYELSNTFITIDKALILADFYDVTLDFLVKRRVKRNNIERIKDIESNLKIIRTNLEKNKIL